MEVSWRGFDRRRSMAVNLRLKFSVAGPAHIWRSLWSTGIHDQFLEKVILQLPIHGNRPVRIEDGKQDQSAILRVEKARQRADSTVGCRQCSGLSDNGSTIVHGLESRLQRPRI